MSRCSKYTVNVIISLICIALISGCFDRRELDTLGIVMGVALDKAQAEGETEVTIQMVNPAGGSKSKESKDGSSGGAAFINLSGTGKNVNYIVREMQHKMSRRIYVAHSQVIVIGEDLAKSGVRDALDFFARAPEARMTLYVFVAKGKGAEVLDIDPEFEKMPSTELAKVLKDQKITSQAPLITEFEFVSSMVSKTTAAVAPLVKIEEENGSKRISVAGCAVFKDSVMVGELNEEETRGLLFVKNKVKTGVMQLDVLETPATIEIRQAKSKVNPVLYSDGTAQFNIEVKMTVGLGDQSGTQNLSDPDKTPTMLSAVEAAVKKEIMSAVEKSKELDSDVFGFADYLNRKYPDQWKDLKGNWNELYRKIDVKINVKAKADGSGRLVKPLVPEGA